MTAESGAATAGFKEKTLTAKADTAFTLVFDDQDPTVPHNVVIEDASKAPVAVGGDTSPFQGPEKRSYAVPADTCRESKSIEDRSPFATAHCRCS